MNDDTIKRVIELSYQRLSAKHPDIYKWVMSHPEEERGKLINKAIYAAQEDLLDRQPGVSATAVRITTLASRTSYHLRKLFEKQKKPRRSNARKKD